MWPNMTDEIRTYLFEVLETGNPPGDVMVGVNDDRWRLLFERYLQENNEINIYDCWASVPHLDKEQIATNYYFEDAPLRIDWPEHIAVLFERVATEIRNKSEMSEEDAQMYDARHPEEVVSTGTLVNAVYAHTKEIVGAMYKTFCADVEDIARRAAGGATLTVDQLDLGYIQSVNEYSWKLAKEAGHVDFKFLADPPILMIGIQNFQAGYPDALGDCDTGTIHVQSRGSVLGGAGSVEVEGSTDHDGFLAAFKQVSDKDVNFA